MLLTPEEVEARFQRIEANLENQQTTIDKQNAGIQSLIVVARTVLDSVKEMRERHEADHDKFMAGLEKLREAQVETGEKLNILVDTVDKMIREKRNGDEG